MGAERLAGLTPDLPRLGESGQNPFAPWKRNTAFLGPMDLREREFEFVSKFDEFDE